MSRYAIEAEPAVEFDVEAAFNWYEGEERGLGFDFLRSFALLIKESLLILSAIGTCVQGFAAH